MRRNRTPEQQELMKREDERRGAFAFWMLDPPKPRPYKPRKSPDSKAATPDKPDPAET